MDDKKEKQQNSKSCNIKYTCPNGIIVHIPCHVYFSDDESVWKSWVEAKCYSQSENNGMSDMTNELSDDNNIWF